MAGRKIIRNLRRIGNQLWTDGKRVYQFAEVEPGAEVIIPNATPWRILATDGNKRAVSVANLSSWIKGTAEQITVTPGLNGTITLSLPVEITGRAKRYFYVSF